MRKKAHRTVTTPARRRTVRRKSNPANQTRKIYYVSGESMYRQRPVFYSRDGRIVGKKLGIRSPRKKLNQKRGMYIMARKSKKSRRKIRRNPIMYKTKRSRVRRNPSGFGRQIVDTLLQGLVTSGTMIGGLYVGAFIADSIAGRGTTAPNPAVKAQYRNWTRALLTIAGAVLLPKFAPRYANSIVSGMFAATTLGFMNTAFGINLGQLAGDSPDPGLLYGGPSFNVSDRLQVGSDWEMPDYSEISGITDFAVEDF